MVTPAGDHAAAVARYHTAVHVVVVTARPELWANRRLEAAAVARDVALTVVDGTAITAAVTPAPHLDGVAGDVLDQRPDAVLARIGNWRPESLLAILECCVAAGVATPNPPPAIRVGRDHWQTVQVLARAGLPVPATVAGADPEQLAAAAVAHLGLPVVVKQRRSRMGVGVIRCDARDHLEAVLDSLWRLGDEVLVQRWIESGGMSQRLLVVGGTVVAAARFEAATGEWRSNGARGGRATAFEPSRELLGIAVAAATTVGLGQCAVDILSGGAGPVVCEVNPTPGFRHLEAACGLDIAGLLIDDALAARTA